MWLRAGTRVRKQLTDEGRYKSFTVYCLLYFLLTMSYELKSPGVPGLSFMVIFRWANAVSDAFLPCEVLVTKPIFSKYGSTTSMRTSDSSCSVAASASIPTRGHEEAGWRVYFFNDWVRRILLLLNTSMRKPTVRENSACQTLSPFRSTKICMRKATTRTMEMVSA